MNVLFSQFGKDWNLYLKKQLIKVICAFLLGAAAGFLVVYLVCAVWNNNSYIYLASILAMTFTGFWIFIVGNELQTHFLLGVSMGQKRKDLIVSALTFLGLLAVIVYIVVNVLFLLEKNVYPVLFTEAYVEGGEIASFMLKWGLPVIGITMLIAWFLFVLNMKFGPKIFWIPYVLWMAVMLLGMKVPDMKIFGRFMNRIFLVISGFSAPVWLALCVAAGICIVLIGSRILMRLDVK